MSPHRALFLTLPCAEAAAALAGWINAGHEIAEIWLPEALNPGWFNRDRRLAWLAPKWSIAALARRNGIPVRRVPVLASWSECTQRVKRADADVLVSVLYHHRVPVEVLDLFQDAEIGRRAVNIHPAPLPEYRGPHPYLSQILDGVIDETACATLHVMEADFDTGGIIAMQPIRFPADGSMSRYAFATGKAAGKLLAEDLPRYLDGELRPRPQDEARAAYRRIEKGDLALGPEVDLAKATLYCRTLGGFTLIDVNGVENARATRLLKHLGAPTGAPAKKRMFSVETDLADARVKLRRKMPWTSAWRKLVALYLRIVTD